MAVDVQGYVLQKNFKLLQKKHPRLLEKLKEAGVEPMGEIVFGPDSKPNLKINLKGKTVFLHPENDPGADQNYFLSKIIENFSGVEVILGMGLGYGAKAVLEERKSIRYLIIIENDPGLFLQALKIMDLSDLLSDPKVIIGLNPEDAESLMAPVIKAISFEDTQILEHPVIATIDRSSHTRVYDMVFNYVNSYNISGATKLKYGEDVVINRFEHLKSMGHYFLFESLLDKFIGVPAYIVAAGPSLDQNIHFLKKVQNRAVIICVDSALPAFLENGIKPDFVTSIDYKDNTYEKIDHKINEIPEDTGLLVYSWAAPKLVKNFPGHRKFYLLTEAGIDQWVNSLANGKKAFASSSSVANLNFISAKLLGCSPVIFVGQDLSYGAGNTHSKSAILTVRDHVNKCLETGKDLVWLKGVQGGEVPTTRGMKNVLDVFENLILNNPGDYINCSTGGAHIKGTKYMDLEEAVDRYYSDSLAISDVIEEVCSRKNQIDAGQIKKKILQDEKIVEKILSLIDRVEKILIKGQSKVPGIKKKWNKRSVLPQKMERLLGEIDSVNSKIDGYNQIWGILEDVTSKGLKKSEQLTFDIQKIQGIPEKYPEWLGKTIDRLLYVNKVRKEVTELLAKGINDVHHHISVEQDLLKKESKADVRTRIALAELYTNSRDYVLAKPYLEEYIAHSPDSAQANFFMGCLKAQSMAFEEMNTYFSKAIFEDISYGKKIHKFRYDLGQAYFEWGGHVKNFDTLVAKGLMLKGLKYCPFHEKMEKRLAKLLDHDLENMKKSKAVGTLDHYKAKIEGWAQTFDTFPQIHAFVSNESISLVYFFNGLLVFKAGDKEKARLFFNKCVAYAPDHGDRYIEIADLFLCSFDYDQGIGYLNKAIELDSGYATYWEDFGDFLCRLGKFDESITAFLQASQYFPDKIKLHEKITKSRLQKGNSLHKNGKFEQAKEVYDEAIQFCPDKDPSLLHLYNNKGSALKNLGKYDEAMACYDKVLELDSGYGESLYNKGELLEHLGEFSAALEYYENAIKKHPEFEIAYHKMGNLLVIMGESEKAMPFLEKAAKLSAKS